MAESRDNRRPGQVHRWAPLVLIALGVLAWSNVFSCAFVLDDKTMLLGNFRLHRLWPPWAAVSVPTRWLADLSFALNHAISGFNAADYHLTNLAIHLTGGLLLYGLVRRTLALPLLGNRFQGREPLLAFAVAALWLVHPLQTESVTYVVQRIESLMGVMFLAVFYTFVRSQESPNPGRWRVASWGLCLLGMGTKEIMTTAPLLLILFDATFCAESWKDVWRKRRGFHAAMLGTLAVFAALLAAGMARAQDEGGLFYGESLRWRYLLTQSQVILHYLRLSIVPYPLCLDYGWKLAGSWRDAAWQAPLLAGLAGCAIGGAIGRRLWAFPALAFFVILAPTSSVMPLPDAIFEHRMYLPLAAVLALGIITLDQGMAHLPSGAVCRIRRAAAAGLAALLALFVALTWLRNEDYRSEENLWRDVIRKRPDNYRAYVSLSTALLNAHRPNEALDISQALLARLPDYRSMSFAEVERLWLAQLDLPVPEYAMGHNNVGAAYLALDRNGDALPHFQEAVRVVPRAYWAHSNVAKALYFTGQTNEAIAAWQTALAIKPNDGQTRVFLAIALASQGRARDAADQFSQALSLNPDDAFARAQLAWMRATDADPSVRNGAEAVRLAEPLVVSAQGQSAQALDILAAAYAEAGRYADAVRTAEKALETARRSLEGPSEAAIDKPGEAPAPPTASVIPGAIQSRLVLYREGRPFHQSPRSAHQNENPAPVQRGDDK